MERSIEDDDTSNKDDDKGVVQTEKTKDQVILSTKAMTHMSMEEEDLIRRMYMLVGNRWDLIAGRIPGRNPTEIQCFWMTVHENHSPLKN